MGEWIEQIAVTDREVNGADPMVKGFTKFVDPEFFDVKDHDRIAGDGGMEIVLQVCVAGRPSGNRVFCAWVATLSQQVDGLGHQGVTQVDHLDIGIGSEDFSTADIVQKRLAREGQQWDRPEGGVGGAVCKASRVKIGGRASYRFIDAVAPTRERGIDDFGAVRLIGRGELGSTRMESHRHVEG